jgi:hypothetical protein
VIEWARCHSCVSWSWWLTMILMARDLLFLGAQVRLIINVRQSAALHNSNGLHDPMWFSTLNIHEACHRPRGLEQLPRFQSVLIRSKTSVVYSMYISIGKHCTQCTVFLFCHDALRNLKSWLFWLYFTVCKKHTSHSSTKPSPVYSASSWIFSEGTNYFLRLQTRRQ